MIRQSGRAENILTSGIRQQTRPEREFGDADRCAQDEKQQDQFAEVRSPLIWQRHHDEHSHARDDICVEDIAG
ncbi:MAG: hypothetical protein EKK35_20140 [Bradyrhizobiaceae bacterium]|nr:MAG: hypothetical protein EKK35_20140 [Bradyrhizobiaceae bacterium]